VVVRNFGGSYELDGASADLLRARRLRLLQRGTQIIGRYGRHGTVDGVVSEHRLSATMIEGADVGSLDVTFDDLFSRFEGTLRIGARAIEVNGQRAIRRRADR
jgi:hypothetical protein